MTLENTRDRLLFQAENNRLILDEIDSILEDARQMRSDLLRDEIRRRVPQIRINFAAARKRRRRLLRDIRNFAQNRRWERQRQRLRLRAQAIRQEVDVS